MQQHYFPLLILLFLAVITTAYNQNSENDDNLSARNSNAYQKRKLLIGLVPSLPPQPLPPGFKPTSTPTDRTKRPTIKPSRTPTKLGSTRSPTKKYPCSLCRPKEKPSSPNEKIEFNGKWETCKDVHSYGILKNKISPELCDFYRNLGQSVCRCRR
jgi:hypothetical protein